MGELLCLRVTRGSTPTGLHHPKAAQSGLLALPPPPKLQCFFRSSFLESRRLNTNKPDKTFVATKEKAIREGSLPRCDSAGRGLPGVCVGLSWDGKVFSYKGGARPWPSVSQSTQNIFIGYCTVKCSHQGLVALTFIKS